MNNIEDGKVPLRSDKSALPVSGRIPSEGRSAVLSDVNDAFTKLSMEPYNGHKTSSSYFMPEDIRAEIIYRNALSVATVEASVYQGASGVQTLKTCVMLTFVLLFKGLPQEVDHYHELVPLEPYCLGRAVKSSSYGLITSTYKATHTKTGIRYCLKRIHGILYQQIMA